MRISLALPLVFLIACPASDDVGGTDTGSTPVADAGAGGGEDAGSGGGGEDAGSGGGGEDAGSGGGGEDAGSGGGGEDAGNSGGGDDAGAAPMDAGPGGGDCRSAWQCVLRCAPADLQCFTACMDQVPAGQEGLVGEVINCMHQNQCEDQACVEQNCVDAVRACDNGEPMPGNDGGPVPPPDAGHGGGGGELTACTDTMACYINCMPDDDNCRAACLSRADPAHAEVTDPLIQCIEQNHCRDGHCVVANCQGQLDACGAAGGGGGPPPGEGITCGEALACMGNCNNDPQCIGACAANVRAESMPLAEALQNCMMANRCMTMECARQNCADQTAACGADQ